MVTSTSFVEKWRSSEKKTIDVILRPLSSNHFGFSTIIVSIKVLLMKYKMRICAQII